MRDKAAWLFDHGKPLRRRGQHGQAPRQSGRLGGRQRLHGHPGGYGFAKEFDVERKFRETRLYSGAVNNNLVLASSARTSWGCRNRTG